MGHATINGHERGKIGSATADGAGPGGATSDPNSPAGRDDRHAPLTGAYDLLNVPALEPGGFYSIDHSVKVLQDQSSTFPIASVTWDHDYAEGGDEVSLPYSARRVPCCSWRPTGAGWWTHARSRGHNGRKLTRSFVPDTDGAFAFSTNPATPYYGYVGNGTSVVRLDIRTMTEAPGVVGLSSTNRPSSGYTRAKTTVLFTWMRGPSGPTVVGYEPSTQTLKTYTNAGIDEPRMERAGRYIGLAMTNPSEALYLWDWRADSIVWTTTAHPGMRSSTWRACETAGTRSTGVNPPLSVRRVRPRWRERRRGSVARRTPVMSTATGAGCSIPPIPTTSGRCSATTAACSRPAPGGSRPAAMNLHYGERAAAAVGASYSAVPVSDYGRLSFARLSADGRYVMFASDMNGAGRTEVFLAEVPTR